MIEPDRNCRVPCIQSPERISGIDVAVGYRIGPIARSHRINRRPQAFADRCQRGNRHNRPNRCKPTSRDERPDAAPGMPGRKGVRTRRRDVRSSARFCAQAACAKLEVQGIILPVAFRATVPRGSNQCKRLYWFRDANNPAKPPVERNRTRAIARSESLEQAFDPADEREFFDRSGSRQFEPVEKVLGSTQLHFQDLNFGQRDCRIATGARVSEEEGVRCQ